MVENSEKPRDPVRRWTLIVLGVIVVIFLYSIIADRMTPYTSQAIVQAYVVRVAPEVAGRVLELGVVDNQKVKAGELLFRIDPQPYEIALKQAEARVDGVGQNIGANTAGVASAQERLIEARATQQYRGASQPRFGARTKRRLRQGTRGSRQGRDRSRRGERPGS
jgi:multidrug resistance efflux pump